MTDEKQNNDAERAEAAAEEAVEAAAAAETAADESPTPETVDAAVEAEEAADEATEAAAEGDAEQAEAAAEQAGEAATKPKRARKPKAEEPADEAPAKPKRTRAKKADEAPAEEPAKPAKADKPSTSPRRRRDQPREVPVGVEVRAQAKYVRTSARKARLVCDHIRGKDVAEARAILAFTPRSVAKDWAKLLESAVANAEHNHELVGEELKVAAVYADEGPTLKRFRPRAMGRATRIRKRTSHLTITLTPKEL
jgi:ribosomal protein L22